MRRAILAGVALGIIAGVLVVYHDAVRLTVAWPVVLGLALWETVGRRGARGVVAAAAAVVGVGAGYLSYAVVSEYFPITNLWLGITIGVAVGLMALIGVATRNRFPVAAMLVGFAGFAGMFEPLWAESPANIRTHGIETVTVAALAVVVGILTVTLVRSVADRTEPTAEREGVREGGERPSTAPTGEYLGGTPS